MKSIRLGVIAVFLCALFVLSACAAAPGGETGALQAGEASYEAYSSARFDELEGDQRFILFFHADWCPLCVRLEGLIKKDLASLGSGVVLEANFDRETDLKREFMVMNQTTVIFFDERGEAVEQEINPSIDDIRTFFAP